ncbi:MAG: TAXI family TRAP transporter solute-binding subunit [Nitratireductor sp.]|nr:TAXI family TRAP transporter solute-binding subunit [Nitratireductor sp.]
MFGLVGLCAAAGGWLYFNREQPLVTLKVAAGPYRSDSYEMMLDVAEVVERQSKRLRLQVMPTRDSSTNISILNRHSADLATIRSDTPVIADVKMVAELFPDFFQIITREDRQIFSIRDLIGKKIAIPPFGTDEFRSFWSVGDHYDLPIDGLHWIAMPFATATRRLLDGDIDAIFTVRSLRDRLLLNLHEDARLKRQRLRILEIEQARAIAVKRPFLRAGIIPKGTFSGAPAVPGSDIAASVVSRILVSRSDVDEALIRELTSILFEHRLDLVIRFALASAIRQPDSTAGITIPLHAGSQAYFDRDQPSFIQENAEPIALGVTVAGLLISGLLTLRARFTSGQKNRMDSYNYMLLEIAEQARATDTIEGLRQLRRELYDILETVVRALDTDEVTEEGFQSFSLLWESVREMIKDQGEMLSGRAA